MTHDLTREEIISLYKGGGWLARYAPTGQWWRYRAGYVPFSSPKWKAGELVEADVDVNAKMRVYALAAHESPAVASVATPAVPQENG